MSFHGSHRGDGAAGPQQERLYWLENYGCQMNAAESRALEGELVKRGWRRADRPEGADLAVLQTCSVRQSAENRIWGRIGFFKGLKKARPMKLVLMGCMASRLQGEIQAREPEVDLVLTNEDKNRIDLWLRGLFGGGPEGEWEVTEDYTFLSDHHVPGDVQAMIPIMHGCNNFCTYCIVPYVRGREVSRPPEDILKEAAAYQGDGVKEITLLGQNVNSYRWRKGTDDLDFTGLLERLLSALDGVAWVRYVSSHPKDLTSRLIDFTAAHPSLCRHIHLPVQHGSNAVLNRMNRGYTREDYLHRVREIREKIPGITFSTDIMVGFPGETEADLEDTLDLMEQVRFDDAFTYYYNPREGTRAADMDGQLSPEEKKTRLDRIIRRQREHSRQAMESRVGTERTVLQERVSPRDPEEWMGRTENNEVVVFRPRIEKAGVMTKVYLESLMGRTYKGKEL